MRWGKGGRRERGGCTGVRRANGRLCDGDSYWRSLAVHLLFSGAVLAAFDSDAGV